VQKRPLRGSYTGYGKRLPSDRPPVLTPKELALAAASDGKNGSAIQGNGQAPGYSRSGGSNELPGGSGAGSGPADAAPHDFPGPGQPYDYGSHHPDAEA
jgi:cell division protease FtsH